MKTVVFSVMAKLLTRLANGFLVIHLCLVSSDPVKVNRCPTDKTERQARAVKLCSFIERYHCLYDTDDILVEDCIDYKQLPPGNYPIYNSFATRNPIDYKPCPRNEYQPWPAKSYEITQCVAKFKCTSEGQIMCSHGNATTDISCTCDHKNGYDSLNRGRCYLYGTQDCSCFKNFKNNTEIDINYNCIETKLSPRAINSTVAAVKRLDIKDLTYYNDNNVKLIGGSSYIIKGVVSAATFILLLACCIVIYVLYNWEIGCNVYNEDYEVRVFKLLNAAKYGDVKTLKSLAGEGYIDMADVDYDRRSALHLAACEGHDGAVEYILKKTSCNKYSTDRWGRTAIADIEWHQQYVENKEIYKKIKMMINNHEANDTKPDKIQFRHFEAKELITAAETGNLKTLKRLKAKGTDMDLADLSGRTPLHAAAEKGIEKVVDYLIDTCHVSPFVRCLHKRPIDLVPDKKEETFNRIRNKLQQTMDNMMARGAEREKSSSDKAVQVVRLLKCAARGDIRRMRSFKKEEYKDICDYDKRTALHIAVSENQEHIVEFLLGEWGLTDDARKKEDRWKITPLEAAKSEAMPVVYNVFLKYYKELIDTENDDYRAFLLINAAKKGDVNALKKLHEKKMDMNLMDYDRRTALHLAAAEEQMKAVQYLVETAKVNVSVSDRGNRYPVDETDNKNIIKIITESQEKDDSPPSYKISRSMKTMPYVMDAALKGKLHLLKNERYEYFTMDSGDFSGNTPLHFAASEGRLYDVKYLLQTKFVSPFVRNGVKKTALDLVMEKIKQLEKLQDDNVGLPATNYHIELREIRIKQLTDIKDLIVKARNDACSEDVKDDENFNKHTEDEKIFLFLNKAYKGDIRAIKRYMKTDPTLVNKVDYDKRSVLHLAAAEGHFDLVKYLLENTAVDVNAKDRWNATPLMEATRFGDSEIIKLIQDKGGK